MHNIHTYIYIHTHAYIDTYYAARVGKEARNVVSFFLFVPFRGAFV